MNRDLPVVDDYMARDLTTFQPDDDIHSAVRVLLDTHFSGAPVVDANGNLAGMLSKKDCLQVVYNTSYHQDWGGQVQDYMTRGVSTLDSGTDIMRAADQFTQSMYRRFPVMERGRMIGQISRCDILRALDERWGQR